MPKTSLVTGSPEDLQKFYSLLRLDAINVSNSGSAAAVAAAAAAAVSGNSQVTIVMEFARCLGVTAADPQELPEKLDWENIGAERLTPAVTLLLGIRTQEKDHGRARSISDIFQNGDAAGIVPFSWPWDAGDSEGNFASFLKSMTSAILQRLKHLRHPYVEAINESVRPAIVLPELPVLRSENLSAMVTAINELIAAGKGFFAPKTEAHRLAALTFAKCMGVVVQPQTPLNDIPVLTEAPFGFSVGDLATIAALALAWPFRKGEVNHSVSAEWSACWNPKSLEEAQSKLYRGRNAYVFSHFPAGKWSLVLFLGAFLQGLNKIAGAAIGALHEVFGVDIWFNLVKFRIQQIESSGITNPLDLSSDWDGIIALMKKYQSWRVVEPGVLATHQDWSFPIRLVGLYNSLFISAFNGFFERAQQEPAGGPKMACIQRITDLLKRQAGPFQDDEYIYLTRIEQARLMHYFLSQPIDGGNTIFSRMPSSAYPSLVRLCRELGEPIAADLSFAALKSTNLVVGLFKSQSTEDYFKEMANALAALIMFNDTEIYRCVTAIKTKSWEQPPAATAVESETLQVLLETRELFTQGFNTLLSRALKQDASKPTGPKMICCAEIAKLLGRASIAEPGASKVSLTPYSATEPFNLTKSQLVELMWYLLRQPIDDGRGAILTFDPLSRNPLYIVLAEIQPDLSRPSIKSTSFGGASFLKPESTVGSLQRMVEALVLICQHNSGFNWAGAIKNKIEDQEREDALRVCRTPKSAAGKKEG